MEKEKRNKVLSKVLIVAGIILSIGGLIAMIADIAGLWNLTESVVRRWLFGVTVGGFDIWILGVLIGRKHRMSPKMVKNVFSYKILVAVGLIGHLTTSFGNDALQMKDPSGSLNRLFIYFLSGCLGLGIVYLLKTRARKEQSAD